MTLRQLKWSTLLAALGFIVLLELVRRALYPYMPNWEGKLLMGAAIFTGSLFFFGALFAVLERMQSRLERKNRELLALHTAALDVYGDLSLEKVLQKVVDQARQLVDARYGALSIVDDRQRIESFLISGLTAHERARIGDPPVGKGLLGVVLHEGQRLRLKKLSDDPRSAGFPPHHPSMTSLLAVPVACQGPFRGNLYLADKRETGEFTAEDEESLVRFATSAGIAIDSAYLHKRLNELAVAEERLRIAHEMHDGLAQVLAYVNTKAQAVKEYLRAGKHEDAARQLDQLAGAAREVYGDVRESIIGLRTAAQGRPVVEALEELVKTWETQTGIDCHLTVDGSPRLTSASELQLLRIVQEALANVRKHAAAKKATVTIRADVHHLRVTVQDDGIGFKPAELGRSDFPRLGLATMRERAEAIGGDLRLESIPGEGTRVTVELPLTSAA
jgi:signal transduction histidine kinase